MTLISAIINELEIMWRKRPYPNLKYYYNPPKGTEDNRDKYG